MFAKKNIDIFPAWLQSWFCRPKCQCNRGSPSTFGYGSQKKKNNNMVTTETKTHHIAPLICFGGIFYFLREIPDDSTGCKDLHQLP